jgi:Holliday junction DNA helicase RuvA
MIAKIFGKIIKKSPSSILVLTGGIGFEILISSRTFEKIPEIGSEAELDIYTHVREDELKLVGFLDLSDKNFFLKLISVSGISIKIALSALSIYSGEELGRIISTREVDLLRRIPGIGLKLAERMIVELKDKLEDVKMGGIIRPGMEENEKIYEVKQALKTLGYNPREIGKAISRLNIEIVEKEKIEVILKMALKEI